MLTVRNLSRSGLEPTSFELAAGECIALRGLSGSGKTLLLRALADLDLNEGEVLLDDTPRSRIPAPRWRRRVGYVAAEPGWWSERLVEHFRDWNRSEEHTSELQSLMRISYAVFCLKKKNNNKNN